MAYLHFQQGTTAKKEPPIETPTETPTESPTESPKKHKCKGCQEPSLTQLDFTHRHTHQQGSHQQGCGANDTYLT